MGLFYRRLLCLLCCLFLLGSVVAWFVPSAYMPYLIAVALLAVASLILSCFLCRRARLRLIPIALCAVSLLASFSHSFLSIDLPQARAWRHVGEREVELAIREVVDESAYSSEYVARLVSVDGEAVGCRVRLVHARDDLSLSVGDRIGGRALVERTVLADTPSLTRNRDGALLLVSLEDDAVLSVRRDSERSARVLWESEMGVLICSSRAREAIGARLSELLGGEVGALSSAFLMGDTAGLSSATVRNFRRAGVSHMMAVSGLHIAVLLGSAELLLRRFLCPKRLRCVTIVVLGTVFLFLTGFSLSACRSVLMFFAVYVSFYSQRTHDTLTSLFFSIALIMALIPYSVTDLGMWMSFLATLGLVCVYPICAARFPRSENRPWMRPIRWLMGIVCITVIANLFLLPVVWIFFGELSLASLLANLLLMPVSYVLLIGTPIFLALSPIPILSDAVRHALLWSGRLILAAAEWCASFSWATVSLRYDFCWVLIPILAALLVAFLVVRLRRRWLVLLLPALGVAAFSGCLTVVWLISPDPKLTYANDGEQNEWIFVEERGVLSVCDVSKGGVAAQRLVYDAYRSSNATEIDTLVLTHCHAGHGTMLRSLCARVLVRTVYLPIPEDDAARPLTEELSRLAREQGSEVVLYESGSTLPMTRKSGVRVESRHGSSHTHAGFLLAFYARSALVSYASVSLTPSQACLRESEALILGAHGALSDVYYTLTLPDGSSVTEIYCPFLRGFFEWNSESACLSVYRPTAQDLPYRFTLTLS